MDNEKFTVEFGEVTNIGGGGTSDFDELTNRPKYNDTTMSSDTNIPKVPAKTSDLTNDGSDGDSTYVEADELAKVATSGSYADLENKPSIPTVNDATLTITQNGTSKGTFTANDADDTTIEVSDTTYSNFTGTDGTAAGAAGLVPAPATTDAGKFLKADGTWDTAGGGGGPTVVQTTGNSTTDVMSQNATTGLLYVNPANPNAINIRGTSGVDGSTGVNGVVIGGGSFARGDGSVTVGFGASNYAYGAGGVTIGGGSATNNNVHATALGYHANANANYSVALGSYAKPTRVGEVNVGADTSGEGYNSTNYRLIGGVHDPIDAHDAATKGYVDAHGGGAGGAIKLTTADYNYDTNGGSDFNTIAIWLLPDDIYQLPDSNVSVTGAVSGSDYTKFTTWINNRYAKYFVKSNNNFWFLADPSSSDATIGIGAPVYYCTVRTNDGRFYVSLDNQLVTKSQLPS